MRNCIDQVLVVWRRGVPAEVTEWPARTDRVRLASWADEIGRKARVFRRTPEALAAAAAGNLDQLSILASGVSGVSVHSRLSPDKRQL